MRLDDLGLAVVDVSRRVCRVGRATNPVGYSFIAPEVDRDDALGYRFDVVGAGVMYAATKPAGAYAETVQAYRPTAATYAATQHVQPGLMVAGNLPASWRTDRRLVTFALPGGLPFLDVEKPASHTALTRHLGAELTELGYAHLDVSLVRSEHRLLTRLISVWAYLQELPDGSPRYGGIRFISKLGDHECWAIFDGAPVADVETQLIPLGDLQRACTPLGVWAH
ncbi:RES domain-containing protein [Salana multivorans]